jgi:pyridoxal biosynthesis lyase PdxS
LLLDSGLIVIGTPTSVDLDLAENEQAIFAPSAGESSIERAERIAADLHRRGFLERDNDDFAI